MATRTSSPPGSRSKSTSLEASTSEGEFEHPIPEYQQAGPDQARRSSASASPPGRARPAPRAVRNGPGPVSRALRARSAAGSPPSGSASPTPWARSRARSAGPPATSTPSTAATASACSSSASRSSRPPPCGGSCPARSWTSARTVVSGSVGKVGWFVPLILVFVGWRNLRDPERNGPAGRQVIGWAALAFGVLGIVHIANGNPQPGARRRRQPPAGRRGGRLRDLEPAARPAADAVRRRAAADAAGVFGVLVITATPVYQVPARLRALRDRLLGRTGEDEDAAQDEGEPTQPMRARGVAARSRRRRHRPRDGRPGLRQPRPRGPRGQAAGSRQGRRDPRPGRDRGGLGRHRRRARAAAAHPAAAARGAARAVRRHHVPAAGQRRAQARVRRTRRAPRPATRSSSGSPR